MEEKSVAKMPSGEITISLETRSENTESFRENINRSEERRILTDDEELELVPKKNGAKWVFFWVHEEKSVNFNQKVPKNDLNK